MVMNVKLVPSFARYSYWASKLSTSCTIKNERVASCPHCTVLTARCRTVLSNKACALLMLEQSRACDTKAGGTFCTGSFLPRAKWSKPFRSKAPSAPRGSDSRSTYHSRLAGSQPLPTEISRYLRRCKTRMVFGCVFHVSQCAHALQVSCTSHRAFFSIHSGICLLFGIASMLMQGADLPSSVITAFSRTPLLQGVAAWAADTAKYHRHVSPAVICDLGAQHPLRVRLRSGKHRHILRLQTQPNKCCL